MGFGLALRSLAFFNVIEILEQQMVKMAAYQLKGGKVIDQYLSIHLSSIDLL